MSLRSLCVLLPLSVAACAPATMLPLRAVTLHGNGLGYSERSGTLSGDRLRLRLGKHEIDDVMKTLAVLGSGDRETVGAVATLTPSKSGAVLELTLPRGGARELHVKYAAPTSTWRAVYRLVLADAGKPSLLQG